MSITLRHKNRVKKLPLTQNLSKEDFSYLIASHFDLRAKITGLQDRQGILFLFHLKLSEEK
jgi:hypothetical protein